MSRLIDSAEFIVVLRLVVTRKFDHNWSSINTLPDENCSAVASISTVNFVLCDQYDAASTALVFAIAFLTNLGV